MTAASFPPPLDRAEQEEGAVLAPRFDESGLIAAIAQDARDGTVLMLAWMNAQALELTLRTGVAHYWSRSRGVLWKKGETSGQLQHVRELRVDCDQDAVLLRVEVGGDGGACHTGRRSCFYRRLEDGALALPTRDPSWPTPATPSSTS